MPTKLYKTCYRRPANLCLFHLTSSGASRVIILTVISLFHAYAISPSHYASRLIPPPSLSPLPSTFCLHPLTLPQNRRRCLPPHASQPRDLSAADFPIMDIFGDRGEATFIIQQRFSPPLSLQMKLLQK